jgi:hypothetical protein
MERSHRYHAIRVGRCLGQQTRLFEASKEQMVPCIAMAEVIKAQLRRGTRPIQFIVASPRKHGTTNVRSGTNYWTKIASTPPHYKKMESQQMVELLLAMREGMESVFSFRSQSVSKSLCRAPPSAHDQIPLPVLMLLSCPCGTSSLTKGRVCFLESLSDITNQLSV